MENGHKHEKQYTVLVTGFGANLNAPYGNATSNPAGMIASTLPSTLPASSPLNTSAHDIQILDAVAGGFAAIPGTYRQERQAIAELHEKYSDQVDLWIHLGRGPWSWVTVERRAFRQDMSCSWLGKDAQTAYYGYRDNEKMTAADVGENPWLNVPIGLETSLDAVAVAQGANAVLEKSQRAVSETDSELLEIHPHFEAGSAGCGFAYYESMAHCWVKGKERNVLFCHVPKETDEEGIGKARDAILAVIGAAIKNIEWRKGKVEGDYKLLFGQVRD